MRSVKPFNSISDLQPGDHAIHIYTNDQERKEVLTDFLNQGLKSGQKVVCILKSKSDPTVIEGLTDAGIDIEKHLESSQLLLLDSKEIFLHNGYFDPGDTISCMRSLVDKTLNEGYPALRMVCEMSWAPGFIDGADKLLEYESKLRDLSRKSKLVSICQFDQRIFETRILIEMLHVHPATIIGTELYDNRMNFNPEEETVLSKTESDYRQLIENLREMKKTLAELRYSEARYRNLAEAAFEGIVIHDGKSLIDANPAFLKMLGYDLDELKKVKSIEIIVPEDGELVRKNIENRHEQPYEIAMLRKDGSRIIVEICGRSMEYQGRMVRVAAVRDISERKKYEQALKNSEERFRAIFETARDCIFIKDLNFRYTLVNPAAANLLGKPASEIIGATDFDLFSPEIAQKIREIDQRVIGGEIVSEDSVRLVNGEFKTFSFIKVPLRDHHGNIYALMGIARDISERAALMEEIKKKSQELEKALKVKSDFLSMVSHELRTPLVPIIGYADMLLDGTFGDIPAYICEPLRIIKKRAEALKYLIDDLLQLAKQDNGDLYLRIKPLNAQTSLKEIISIYTAIDHGKPVEFELLGDEIHILADHGRFVQIIQNLIENSIKYSNESVQITISTSTDANWGLIEISDNGIGISNESMDLIFERFYQAENVNTRKNDGVGLGLAIVKELVISMGGSVSVSSRLGEGSTFTVKLPLASEPNQFSTSTANAEKLEQNVNNPFDKILIPKKKVLAIDDDAFTTKLLETLLRDSFEITCCNSVNEGLKEIKKNHFDLILLDWVMPGINGIELLKILKTDANTAHIPVIVLSSNTEECEVQEAIGLGADDYIIKPFSKNQIIRQIESLLVGMNEKNNQDDSVFMNCEIDR